MEWHGTTKMGGQDEATALPSASEAHRVGESLDSRERILCTCKERQGSPRPHQAKQYLLRLLLLLLAVMEKKKKFMVPWICVHMGRELSSTFFLIIIITGMF